MAPKTKKPAPAPVLDDIDLAAALAPGPPAPPQKRGRGRPRSTTPKPPPPPRKYKVRKDKGIRRKPAPAPPQDAPIYINIGGSIDNINRGDNSAVADLKEKLTEKELKFLEIYLGGSKTIESAMIQAGFGDYSPDYRYVLSRKILNRYESQTQDHRIIARAIGAGEVFILKTLYSLAKDSKSEKIRIDAAMNLAKILGITKEQLEGAGGITIIFEQPDGERPASVALPGVEPAQPATYAQPVKVLQITK